MDSISNEIENTASNNFDSRSYCVQVKAKQKQMNKLHGNYTNMHNPFLLDPIQSNNNNNMDEKSNYQEYLTVVDIIIINFEMMMSYLLCIREYTFTFCCNV